MTHAKTMNEDIGQMTSSSNPASSSQAAKKLKGHGHPVRCMSVVRGPKHQSLLMTWEKTFQLVSLGGPSGQRSADAYQKVASWTSTFTATCIASNSSGITWVGYADGSVAVLQPRNGTLEPEKAQVMFNTSPTAITVSDETGEAWIGDSTGRLKVVHHRGYRIKHEKYAFDPDPDHPELSDILGKSRGSVACLLLVGQMAVIGLSCRRSTISVRSVKKAELLDVFDLKGSVVEPPTCLSQVPPEHGSRDGSTNIISGHAAGRVLLWKLQEGKLTLLAQLCKDIGGIRGIVYFPDLPVLLLGHDGGIISLLAMPQILQPPVISPPGTRPTPWPWHNVVLKVHRYGLVAFCASSDFVITSSYLGTVRAYPHSLLLAEAKKYGFKISRHYDVLTHTSVGDPDGWNVIRRGEGTPSSTAIFGQTSSEMAPHHSTRPPALPMDTSALVSDTSDPPTSSRSLMRSAHASRIHLTADLQALASQALPDDALPDDARPTRRVSAVGGRSGPVEARHSAIPARLEENGDVSVRGPRTRTHAPGGNTTPIEIPRHAQSPHHAHLPGTPEPHVHNITNFGNLSPSSSSNLPNGGNMQPLMAVHVDSEDHLAGLLQQTLSPGQIIQYRELGEMSYLGQGSYGTVHHAKWQGTEVAIKQLMNVKSLDDPQAHSFVSEVRMLQRVCHHPNVMRMCGVCLKPPMLVTQYYRNGPLVKLLTSALQGDAKSIKILTWQKRLSMLHDIATAMIHLHKQGIVHADLRTPNIFLTSDWKIQIGDFGLAREVGEMGSVRMSEPTHPRYRPPEVFKQMMWNPAADVWTFGVIMWEMLTWRPAAQMTMAHTAQVVLAAHNDPDSLRPRMPTEEDIQGKVGTGLDSYKDLMMVCLSMDPTNRPTFEHISSRLSNLLLWNTVKIQLVTAAHKQVLMLNAIKSMRPGTISDTQSLKSTPSETESDVGLNRKARDIIVAGVMPAGGAAAPPGLPLPQRPNAASSALPYRKPDLEPFGPESLIAPDARGAPTGAPAAPSSMLPRGEASGARAASATPTSTTRDFMPTDMTPRNAPHGRESESGSHSLRGATDTREVPSPPMTPTKYSPFSQFSPGRSSPAAGCVSRGANTPVSPRFSNQPSGIPSSPFLAWSPTSSPQPSPRTSTHSSTSTAQQQGKGSLTFQPASTMDQPANSIPPGSPYAAGINGPFHAFMDNISFSPQPSPRASAPTTPRTAPSLTGVSSQATSHQPDSSFSHSVSSAQRKAFDSTRLGSIKGLSPLPRLSSSSIKDHHQSPPTDKTSSLDRIAQNEYPLPLIIGMVTALQLAAPQTSSEQALECLKVMVSFRFQGDWAGVGVRESTEQEGSGSPATSATSSSLTTPAPAPDTTPAPPHGMGASSTPREADAQPPPAPVSATCNLLPSATIEEDETIYPVHYPTVDFATNPYDSFASLPSRSSRASWPFEHLTTSGSNAAKLAEICDDVAREFTEKLRSSKDRSTSRTSSARNTDAFAAAYLEELDGPPSIFTPPGARPPAPVPSADSQPSEADPPSERSMQRSISKESPRPGSAALDAPTGLSLTVKKPAAVSVQPSASPPVTPTASPPPSPFSNSNNVFAVLAATQASPRNVGPRLPTPERSPRPAPGSDKSSRPPWESNAAASPRPPSASQPSQGSSQGLWPDGASGMFETPQTPGKSPRRTAPSWPNSASSWQEQQAAIGPYSGLKPVTPSTDLSHNTASQHPGTSLSHSVTQPYGPPPPLTQAYAPPPTHPQDPHPFSSPGSTYTQAAASGRRSHPELAGRPAGYPGSETHSPFSINNIAPRSAEPDTGFGFTPGGSAYARHPMAASQTGHEAAAASTAQNGPPSPDNHHSHRQRVTDTTTTSYPSDTSRALFQQHAGSQGEDNGRVGGPAGRARQASNRATPRELQDNEISGIGSMNGRDNTSLYPAAGMGMTGKVMHARAPGAGVTSPPSPARAADWDRQQQQVSRPMWPEHTGHAPSVTHMPVQGYSSMALHVNAVQSPFNIIANQNANQPAMQSLGYDLHHGSLQADPRSPTSPQMGMVPTGNISGRHDPGWRPAHPNFNTPNTQETHYSAPAALGYQTLERNLSSYSTQQAGTLTSTPSRTASGAPSLSRCGRLAPSITGITSEAQMAAVQAVCAADGFPEQYASAAGRAQTMDSRSGDMADSRAAASSRSIVAQPEQPAASRSGSSFLTKINNVFVNKQGKRSTMESSRR